MSPPRSERPVGVAPVGTGMWAHLADIDDVGVVCLQMASGSLAAVTGSHVSPKTRRGPAWQPAPH